jgi:hypothetical protein
MPEANGSRAKVDGYCGQHTVHEGTEQFWVPFLQPSHVVNVVSKKYRCPSGEHRVHERGKLDEINVIEKAVEDVSVGFIISKRVWKLRRVVNSYTVLTYRG